MSTDKEKLMSILTEGNKERLDKMIEEIIMPTVYEIGPESSSPSEKYLFENWGARGAIEYVISKLQEASEEDRKAHERLAKSAAEDAERFVDGGN